MKLIDLFEFDPKVAGAAQAAASGIGQAADALKGPVPLTRIGQEADNIRNDFNKYATANQGQMTGVDILVNFLKDRKDKKPRDEVDLDKGKIIGSDDRFNSDYIRGIFRQIAKAELQYAKDNPPDTKVRRSMATKPDIKKAPGVIAPK